MLLWNLLYIKTIYIKGKKKNTNGRQKKKIVTIVATMPPRTIATIPKKKKKKGKVPHQSTVIAIVLAQCKHIECTVPKHCSSIVAIVKFVVK